MRWFSLTAVHEILDRIPPLIVCVCDKTCCDIHLCAPAVQAFCSASVGCVSTIRSLSLCVERHHVALVLQLAVTVCPRAGS